MRAQHTSPIQAPPVVSPTTQLRLFRLQLRLPLNVVVPQYPLLDSIYKLPTRLRTLCLPPSLSCLLLDVAPNSILNPKFLRMLMLNVTPPPLQKPLLIDNLPSSPTLPLQT